MEEKSYIYEMSEEKNGQTLTSDILEGKAFNVIISLLAGRKSAKMIAEELRIPIFTVQLYLKRLLESGLIMVDETRVIDGKILKIYVLKFSDINFINDIRKQKKDITSKENLELSAEQFSILTKQAIRGIDLEHNKPHKIKAYFIKADQNTMEMFQKELENLYEKYQSLENEAGQEVYGLINVFAPYTN